MNVDRKSVAEKMYVNLSDLYNRLSLYLRSKFYSEINDSEK